MGSESFSDSKYIRKKNAGAPLVYTDPEPLKRAAITFSFVPLPLQTHQHLIKVFTVRKSNFNKLYKKANGRQLSDPVVFLGGLIEQQGLLACTRRKWRRWHSP